VAQLSIAATTQAVRLFPAIKKSVALFTGGELRCPQHTHEVRPCSGHAAGSTGLLSRRFARIPEFTHV
jgi:hypothetical protein